TSWAARQHKSDHPREAYSAVARQARRPSRLVRLPRLRTTLNSQSPGDSWPNCKRPAGVFSEAAKTFSPTAMDCDNWGCDNKRASRSQMTGPQLRANFG